MLVDSDSTGEISFSSFVQVLKKLRIEFDEQEMRETVMLFSSSAPFFRYKDFLSALVGTPNRTRTEVIKRIFEKLDKENKGYITLNCLRFGYIPGQNSKCRLGLRSESSLLSEFLDAVEYFFVLFGEGNGNSLRISFPSFLSFFSLLSFAVADDEIFQLDVQREWGLTNLALTGKYKNREN